MDPARTAFIDNLPCGDADSAVVVRALSRFGVVSWKQIGSAENGRASGFAEFQARVNMLSLEELIKEALCTVTIESQPGDSRLAPKEQSAAAAKAAVAALKSAAAAFAARKNESVGPISGWTSMEPDGTLLDNDSDFPAHYMDEIRADIKSFRKMVLDAQQEMLSGKGDHMSKLELEFERFKGLELVQRSVLEKHRAEFAELESKLFSKTKTESPEEILKQMMQGQPIPNNQLAALVQRCEEEEKRDAELLLNEEQQTEHHPPVEALVDEAAKPNAPTTETEKPAASAIETVVTEFFGQPEQSIVDFIGSHLKENGDRVSLVEKLRPTLEEDAEEFCEQLWAALNLDGNP